jgi:hypothetical protein
MNAGGSGNVNVNGDGRGMTRGLGNGEGNGDGDGEGWVWGADWRRRSRLRFCCGLLGVIDTTVGFRHFSRLC